MRVPKSMNMITIQATAPRPGPSIQPWSRNTRSRFLQRTLLMVRIMSQTYMSRKTLSGTFRGRARMLRTSVPWSFSTPMSRGAFNDHGSEVTSCICGAGPRRSSCGCRLYSRLRSSYQPHRIRLPRPQGHRPRGRRIADDRFPDSIRSPTCSSLRPSRRCKPGTTAPSQTGRPCRRNRVVQLRNLRRRPDTAARWFRSQDRSALRSRSPPRCSSAGPRASPTARPTCHPRRQSCWPQPARPPTCEPYPGWTSWHQPLQVALPPAGPDTGRGCPKPTSRLTTSLRLLRIVRARSTPSQPLLRRGLRRQECPCRRSFVAYFLQEFPAPCPAGRQASVGHSSASSASSRKNNCES